MDFYHLPKELQLHIMAYVRPHQPKELQKDIIHLNQSWKYVLEKYTFHHQRLQLDNVLDNDPMDHFLFDICYFMSTHGLFTHAFQRVCNYPHKLTAVLAYFDIRAAKMFWAAFTVQERERFTQDFAKSLV